MSPLRTLLCLWWSASFFYSVCFGGLVIPTVPEWNDFDIIEVWALTNPLPTSNAGQVPIFTMDSMAGALGFVNRNARAQNSTVIVEYSPENSILDALFPGVVRNKLEVDVMWNDASDVDVVMVETFGQWHDEVFLMEISGEMFFHYVCWIDTYLQANSSYELFSVKPNSQDPKLFITSTTTFDFMWASFEALWNLGGKMVLTDTEPFPFRNFLTLYTNQPPQKVDFQTNRDRIVQFYEVFQWNNTNSTSTLQNILHNAADQFNGDFYYFYIQDYYLLKLVDQRISVEWKAASFAQHQRNKKLVPMDLKDCPYKPLGHTTISAGGVFAIIMLLVFFLYCFLGIIYKSTHGKAKGWERLPNHIFWQNVFRYTKIGVLFAFTKIKYCLVVRKTKEENHAERSTLLDSTL